MLPSNVTTSQKRCVKLQDNIVLCLTLNYHIVFFKFVNSNQIISAILWLRSGFALFNTFISISSVHLFSAHIERQVFI